MEYLKADTNGLQWGQLIQGTLVKRYKRFFADIQLADGSLVTAHTPNTGRMTGCSKPGSKVYISPQNNPSRKLKYTLEMVESNNVLVGVNTAVPNKLAAHWISKKLIKEIPYPLSIKPEIKIGLSSRLDLQVTNEDGTIILIEIKNCTLAENRKAFFPDAVTERGAKHLEELIKLKYQGYRAILFILVQREDADIFSPADHIDPFWGETFRKAYHAGVEMLCYQASLTPSKISFYRPLPIEL